MINTIKNIINNHKVFSFFISFAIGFILGIYILLFIFAKDSAKLTSLSTIISFLLGQVFTIIFITYQINENRENNIYDKKYEVINLNSENIIEIVSGVKRIFEYKSHLSMKLGKMVDTGDYKDSAINFINDIDDFRILYSKYYKQIFDTLELCKSTKNKFIIYDIKYVDDILIPLEKIIDSLSNVKGFKELTDIYLNSINVNENDENDKNYLTKVSMKMNSIYYYMFTKKNILKVAKDLYSQFDNLQDIKEKNKK